MPTFNAGIAAWQASNTDSAIASFRRANALLPNEPTGIKYVPRDGHHVVQLYTALAHGREGIADRHPRLITRRRLGRTRKVG